MLTYATLDDFKIAKQIKRITPGDKAGITAELLALADEKISDYLIRATRYISRFTRRDFFPYRQIRKFPVPHTFSDLRERRYLSSDLYMDEDLLEVKQLANEEQILRPNKDYFFQTANIYPIQAIGLKFPNFWGGLYAATTMSRAFDDPVINVDGIWGYHDRYPRENEAWVDTKDTVGSDIDATQTSITVSDADGKDAQYLRRFTIGNLIRVEEEFMEVVDINTTSNTLTVLRGIRGTEASAHLSTKKIFRWRVVEDIVQACMVVAKVWRESDTAAGGRMGVTDMSAGIEIGIPGDVQTIIKMYQRTFVGR